MFDVSIQWLCRDSVLAFLACVLNLSFEVSGHDKSMIIMV